MYKQTRFDNFQKVVKSKYANLHTQYNWYTHSVQTRFDNFLKVVKSTYANLYKQYNWYTRSIQTRFDNSLKVVKSKYANLICKSNMQIYVSNIIGKYAAYKQDLTTF